MRAGVKEKLLGEPAIYTHGLSRSFGSVTALTDLNLRVPYGVIYGLIGPNGAGKTTTIRLLLGLLRPSSGQASVLGCGPVRFGNKVRISSQAMLHVIEHEANGVDGLYYAVMQVHANPFPFAHHRDLPVLAIQLCVFDGDGSLGGKHLKQFLVLNGELKALMRLSVGAAFTGWQLVGQI